MISPLFAGDTTPAPAPAASYESCWFLGGGGDYLLDSEETYWNGHIGYNLSDASSLFLEVGWVGDDEDFSVGNIDFNVDIVPVTFNYQYEWALCDQLSWYLGVGAGAASIDVDAGDFWSDDQWSFMAQAFTGLVYEFTPSVEGYLGVRYMWFDEPDFNEGGADLNDFDDFGVGAGLRFNF